MKEPRNDRATAATIAVTVTAAAAVECGKRVALATALTTQMNKRANSES